MTIRLGEILFPLRYDVVAQAPFVELYQSRDWQSTEALVEAARSLVLEAHVAMLHEHERELVGADTLLASQVKEVFERYYRARVEKLAGLCDSLAKGWDYTDNALAFNQPPSDGLTSMDNPVPPGHFLCNGQHRMIVLYGMGMRELRPKQYNLRPMDSGFIPLETTGVYVKAGLITEKQFVEFARLRFHEIPKRIRTVKSLAWWMQNNGPEWVIEYIKLYWRTA